MLDLDSSNFETHITSISKLTKYAKKSNFYKLPTLIHNNRDHDNLEFNTLIPAFSQLDLVERIKAIGFSHQVAMDGDGQLCVVAISSDTVPTALLYPDANGNFNYRAPHQCPFSLAIKAEFKANALRSGIRVGPQSTSIPIPAFTTTTHDEVVQWVKASLKAALGDGIIQRDKAPSSTRSDGNSSMDKGFYLQGLYLGRDSDARWI